MKKTIINELEEVDLNQPIFIEALPGIGHVGKLAADHIIDELGATKFAEIYSPSFPPQVMVDEEGIIETMKNEFYYLKSAGEEERDYLFLVGNTQGLSPEGQYEICGLILDMAENYGVKEIYTLGGLVTGQAVEKTKVFGAATNKELAEKLKEHNVTMRSADGGIIGASGLLLGMGTLRGMQGACLMGETPGYFIDAKAAKAMLNVLVKLLKLEVDTEKLDKRAEETRKMISKAQQMEQEMMERMTLKPGEEDLRYIG
ncbi:MAG: proteasome assembly chaperone family protein [Euryarchaeota archaeon]|nr:proteasome assembly chaperone family protein [Euryarchaeota archaeon]MBV1730390.1 proteasome assembly chaperone family protein [Methanobacterium sp.]MBU4548211.1 proteasome assembly chaperone family protein [Euryarchaeota archaeon]MBU4608744.1 proteasome assembly chaperone family protein [Euryarchaeota archaeon]MBV1755400.1 proteasome assembly chaperone family protein [Methanobacterium sp.]